MLEVTDLHAAYGRIPIVNGVSLSVAEGEVVGVLGHNGMGKTTLLKTLMGYLRATGGRVSDLEIDVEDTIVAVIGAGGGEEYPTGQYDVAPDVAPEGVDLRRSRVVEVACPGLGVEIRRQLVGELDPRLVFRLAYLSRLLEAVPGVAWVRERGAG